MTKTACVFKNEANKVREIVLKANPIIPKLIAEKKFVRDVGFCPECFAEMVFREGVTTCDLCGYTECE